MNRMESDLDSTTCGATSTGDDAASCPTDLEPRHRAGPNCVDL